MTTTAVASSWGTAALRDCCDIVAGSTPSREVAQFWDGPIPWATPKDLSDLDSPVLENTPEGITQEGFDSCSTQMLPKGAVLFSSRAPIGLVAIAGRPMCTNQGFKSFVPGPGVDSLYLYYCLKSMVPQIQARGNGATFKEVSKEVIGTFEIPIPFPDDPRRSLAEQKRIAAILDKADAIRRRRQEAARLADTLIPSVFYEMFGDPTFNRHKWPEMTMLEVTEKVTDGEHITPLRTSNGIKLLSARNVKNGFIDLDEDVDFVGPEEFERIRQRCDPRQGDVLISCSGTVGRVTTVRITEPFTLVRSVAMVRPNTSIVNADYLEYYLRTEHAQRHINRSANKSSQANIFLGPIKKLPILVPPIERQRDFLAKAEQCRTLAARMADATRLADDGFNSFVQRAFRGEL